MLIFALLSGGWQRLLLRATNHLWKFPDLSNTKSSKIICKVQHVSGSHTDTVVQNHWGFSVIIYYYYYLVIYLFIYSLKLFTYLSGQSSLTIHRPFLLAGISSPVTVCCLLPKWTTHVKGWKCLWGGRDGILLQAEQNTSQAGRLNQPKAVI